MRKERLTYRDLVRRILAGSLLHLEERRAAEGILALHDHFEVALRLAELLNRVADRGGLLRLARRPADRKTLQRFLDPTTNDHWSVEVPGPAPVPARPKRSEPAADAAPVEPSGNARPVENVPAVKHEAPRARLAEPPAAPRIVQPVSVVETEPGIARRFVDEAGEPMRTLFGTFSPCATPEELGSALTPLRDRVVERTSATSVRFHALLDGGAVLVPVPVHGEDPAAHEPLDGRVASDVLQHRRMLHVPNVAVPGVNASGKEPGALFCAPLVSGETVSGLLEVRRSVPGPFDEDELRFFSVVAHSAGGALARAEVLEKLIFLDRLTGLYNRAYFDDQIEREIERANRNGTSVALLMCDLDHFKKVNDSHGHLVGDQALVQLAAIIRSNIRQIDLAARYGGEEFAILLPSITRARTARTAERIRRVVADSRFGDVIPELGEHRLSISVGFALYPDDAATAKQLIDRADRVALYAAKNRGRNRVVPWSAAREPRSGVVGS
jgi:diguanylate cyclase (GGDEF)-like protein